MDMVTVIVSSSQGATRAARLRRLSSAAARLIRAWPLFLYLAVGVLVHPKHIAARRPLPIGPMGCSRLEYYLCDAVQRSRQFRV